MSDILESISELTYWEIPEPKNVTVVSYCVSGGEAAQTPRNRIKALLKKHGLVWTARSLFMGTISHSEVAECVNELHRLLVELSRTVPGLTCRVSFGSSEPIYEFPERDDPPVKPAAFH